MTTVKTESYFVAQAVSESFMTENFGDNWTKGFVSEVRLRHPHANYSSFKNTDYVYVGWENN